MLLDGDHNALVAFRLASKLVKNIKECLDENRDTNTKQVAVFHYVDAPVNSLLVKLKRRA